jgi:Fe-S-cluster containining protein
MDGPRRFSCIACGKCCYGQVPLTLKDAFTFAGLFPLGIVWTPVQRGSGDFRLVRTLGVTLPRPDGKELASLIVPTAFLPATFACPALADGKTCGIQREKPSRCKTMPFYPYREEKNQAELLKPREGWECDISDSAPIVYEGRKIVPREDFDREKADLLEQVPQLRRYAEYMLKYSAGLSDRLWAASLQEKGARVVTSLSSLLTALRHPESAGIARQQEPVLRKYAGLTAIDPKLGEFHAYYSGWAREMGHLASA